MRVKEVWHLPGRTQDLSKEAVQGGGGGKGCHRVQSISPVTTSRGDSGGVRETRLELLAPVPGMHVIPALMAYSLPGNRDNRQGN